MKVPAVENPFPGLRPFEPEESHLYFGRDDQTDELLERLEHTRFLAVVGSSGSGKSSLVRAGLLPALHRGHMSGAGSRWRVALFRPGDDPIGGLALALSQPRELVGRSSLGLVEAARDLDSRDNLLVVVDQFEELFRFNQPGTERDGSDEPTAFVKLLLRASEEEGVPVFVVLTMRSDYLGNCARFHGLPEALNGGQYLIPRMTRDQLAEAIESPVAVRGAEITPRLVQRLLNDVGDNPDQLPVLQHALMRTWSNWAAAHADGQPVDLPHYEATGGMAEALNRHAEEAYEELSGIPRGQEIAQKLFQWLTEKGMDQRENRRPTKLRELCEVTEADQARVIEVINRFRSGDRTFLTSPDGEVLTTDSVIDISHESLIRLWQRLRDWSAEETVSAERYQRLARAAQLHVQGEESLWHDPALQLALDWKDKYHPNIAWAARYHPGFEEAMRFLEESRQARESARRRHIAAITGLCLLTLVSLIFAALAIYGWMVAYEQTKQIEEHKALGEAQKLAAQADLAFKEGVRHLERGALLAIESMNRVPLFENDSALRQALSLLPVARLTHGDYVRAIAFSPDGRYLATGSSDKTARLLETTTGKELARLTHEGSVKAITFSPDGRYLATGSDDKTARVFEAATGRGLTRLTHGASVNDIAFSPDGRYLATGSDDKTVRVFEAATGTELARLTHGASVNDITFSPDGRYLATGSWDKTARVFEAATGKKLARLPHEDSVLAIAFSPDGRYLATGSGGKTARVFEVASGKELTRLPHEDSVLAIAFSPDGRYLATGSGRYAIMGSADNAARVFEVASGKEFVRLPHQGPVSDVTFSPDGYYLATGSDDNAARVFEIDTGKELARLTHEDSVLAITFSPDGRYLATGSDDNAAWVFEVDTGRELARLIHEDSVLAIAFSPDGRYLATGSSDKTARVFEVDTDKEFARLIHEDSVLAIAFSPDGRYLDTVSGDKLLTVRRHILRPEDLIAEVCSRLTRHFTQEEWTQYLGDTPYRKTCLKAP